MKDERFIVTYRIQAGSYEEAKAIAWAVQGVIFLVGRQSGKR